MNKLNQIYKCNACGNIVEIVHAGASEIVCCGEPMELKSAKTEDEGYEKHVPVIEKFEDGYLVKVGENPHPMEEEHYIEWIELIADNMVYRKHLSSGDKPEAQFNVEAKEVTAREYCNVHGHWGDK